MASVTFAAGVKPCAAKASVQQRAFSGRIPSVQQQCSFLSQSRRQSPRGQHSELSRLSNRRTVQTNAVQELYQVADLGSFVTGTAATIFAMTLVGLAIGFVLLRFEALVEEGKI